MTDSLIVEDKLTDEVQELRQHVAKLEKLLDERKTSEQSLQQQVCYLQSLMENTSDGIFIIDSEGMMRYNSPSHKRILGYEPDEIIDNNIFGSVHLDDLPIAVESVKRLLEQPHEVVYIELRVQHKNGSWRYIEATATNRLDDPVVNGIAVNFKDITERKQAEEELLVSEGKFRSILNNMQDGYCRTDKDGYIVMCNPALAAIGKYESPDEVLGKNMLDFIYTEDVLAMTSKLLEEGQVKSLESKVSSKDGTLVPIEFSGRVLLSDNGEFQGFEALARDITERKQAEEELRASEEKFRSILNNMQDGYCRTDKDGYLVMCNPALLKLAGYTSEEEILGKNISCFMYDEDVSQITSELMEKGHVERLEVAILNKDRTYVPFELSGQVVLDDNGEFQGFEALARDIFERERTGEAMRNAELRYRNIFNNPLQAVFINDLQGSFVEANDYALNMLGYSFEDIKKLNYADILHPEDISIAFEFLAQVAMGSGMPPIEVRCYKKSGEIIWLSTLTIPLDHESVMGFAHDITERKQAEMELRASEEEYRSILNNMHDGYCRMDREGKLVLCNHSLLKLFGCEDPEELLGNNMWERLRIEDTLAITSELMEKGRVERSEAIVCRNDGPCMPIEFNGHALLNNNGEIQGFEGLARDITGQKNAEQLIREAESRYKAIFNSTSQMGYVVDLQGSVIETNTSALEQMEYSQDEMARLTYQGFAHPDDLPMCLEYLAETLAGHKPCPIEARVLKKSGEVIWIESTMIPLLHDNELYAVLGLAQNITDRKQAEAQRETLLIELGQSNKRLSQSTQEFEEFVYVSYHDLQEPLRRIASFANLLSGSLRERLQEDEQENLAFIMSNANRMQNIINALLAYSQVTSKTKPFTRVDLAEIIDTLRHHELATLLEETKGLLEIVEPLDSVFADDMQMHQLLYNMIENGLKYHKEDSPPQVRVTSTTTEDRWVTVRISDVGIGIASCYHDEIFKVFRILHSPSEHEGLGAGLAIAKRIVERHGGDIGVDSVPGQGATFWFTIPCCPRGIEE